MTDEALLDADRLEEDGRWEEAAFLRLTDGGVHRTPYGTVWTLREVLHVWGPSSEEWWSWRLGRGWLEAHGSTPVWAAGSCPADVRRAVEEAVRCVLERRFGGAG